VRVVEGGQVLEEGQVRALEGGQVLKGQVLEEGQVVEEGQVERRADAEILAVRERRSRGCPPPFPLLALCSGFPENLSRTSPCQPNQKL